MARSGLGMRPGSYRVHAPTPDGKLRGRPPPHPIEGSSEPLEDGFLSGDQGPRPGRAGKKSAWPAHRPGPRSPRESRRARLGFDGSLPEAPRITRDAGWLVVPQQVAHSRRWSGSSKLRAISPMGVALHGENTGLASDKFDRHQTLAAHTAFAGGLIDVGALSVEMK